MIWLSPFSFSLAHTHTLSLSLFFSHSLSLSHTLSLPHTLSLTLPNLYSRPGQSCCVRETAVHCSRETRYAVISHYLYILHYLYLSVMLPITDIYLSLLPFLCHMSYFSPPMALLTHDPYFLSLCLSSSLFLSFSRSDSVIHINIL